LDTKRFNYWSSLALSADGSRLAAFSLGVDTEWVPFLKVFDVATGREEYVLRPPELGTSVPDAPLQDVEENRKVWVAWMKGTSVPDAPLQFALDGTRLLLLLAKTDLAIWELEPGGRATLGVRIKAESAGWVAAALSPDGRRVAACDEAGALRLWNADDGQPILTVHGERGGRFHQLRFSPDGRWLASCVDATGVVVWDSVLGKVVRRWEGHRDRIGDLAFRPDGFLVTASSDGIKTWGPWTAEGVRTLKAPFSVEALAFSPDGRRLFGLSLKGSIVAWDLRAGRPLWTAFKEGHPFVLRWAL